MFGSINVLDKERSVLGCDVDHNGECTLNDLPPMMR